MVEGLEHGDDAADRGFVAECRSGARGQGFQGGAVKGDQVLVRGHDRNPPREGPLDGRERSLCSAHQLDEEIDVLGTGDRHRVAADFDARQVRVTALLGVRDRDPGHAEWGADRRFHVSSPLAQEAKEPGADNAAADHSEPDGGWHEPVQPNGPSGGCQTREAQGPVGPGHGGARAVRRGAPSG